jgi:prevent-host-death family protein
MAKRVSLYEAKTHLSALVEEAADGEEIVVTKHGKAKARLVRLEPETAVREPRRLGVWRYNIDLKPGWDDPLPEDIIAAMCGEDPNDPLNAPPP